MGIKEKLENFNSLRPILFDLCKKKTRGDVNLPPPPPGIGLNCSPTVLFRHVSYTDTMADTLKVELKLELLNL